MSTKNIISKLFLFLVTGAAILITISGFLTTAGENLLFQLLFLPVTAYLLYASFQTLKKGQLEVVLSQKKTGLFFFFLLFFVLSLIAINNLRHSGEKTPSSTSQEEMVLPPSSPQPTLKTERKVIITTENPNDKVNLREAPSTDAKVIARVGQDEKFILIQEEGDWYQVKLEDSFGYLFRKYAAILEE